MTRALVPARIGQVWILLDAEIVHEILGAELWLPIPGARAELPGIMAWQGRAIPIVDLAAPFGLPRLGTGESRPRTLIANVAESAVAVPLDAVREARSGSSRPTLSPFL